MNEAATWHGRSRALDMLFPLAARYAPWLGLPAGDGIAEPVEKEPSRVRAMPLVLRMERDPLPPRTALLEAAASAAVALSLDERSLPGGVWNADVRPWLAGRIRKVARRARGAHWAAVEDLPGVTMQRGDARVRALLPTPAGELPRAVTRLQVAGTDLPVDDAGASPQELPVLWLAPQPPMTVGKAAAQVGHATVLLAALLAAQDRFAELDWWSLAGYPCAVRTAKPTLWSRVALDDQPARDWCERSLLVVRDAGLTEVAPGTVTCVARWPTRPGG